MDKSCCFSSSFLICGFFEDAWSRDSKTERESENIIIYLKISQSAIKSNAKSIAFASAVKVEEPSGIRMFSE